MFRQAVLALLLVGNAAAFLAPCASRAQLMAQTQSTVATKVCLARTLHVSGGPCRVQGHTASTLLLTWGILPHQGRMYMLFGGAEKKKEEGAAGGAKPAGKMNPL
jgi:hypothetical protein